jgi:ribonuclease HII
MKLKAQPAALSFLFNLTHNTSMQNTKKITAGVDEVGRGPLAGPVMAAAVILPLRFSAKKLKDSKQLTKRQREEWYEILTHDPRVSWGIGKVSEKVIDKINIHQATLLAMKRAVENLSKKKKPTFLYIDGTATISLPIKQEAVIKGDTKIKECSAASVIAKVTRDRLMQKYHVKYPKYGFNKNKGYGTEQHIKALLQYGPVTIHRKSFSPIQKKKY